jgi:tRNA A37 threonylcarbamoyladenosine modification protein TsaB
MFNIYIDTTERFAKKVILEKNGKEIDKIEGDIDVTTSIQKILRRNEITLKEIDEFIPNPGPGSFTGIKIGVTIANILNWILGKKKKEELIISQYGKSPNIQPRV